MLLNLNIEMSLMTIEPSGTPCLWSSQEEEIWAEYDAEKIDVRRIVGKKPGEDLVVTSWASGQQQQQPEIWRST